MNRPQGSLRLPRPAALLRRNVFYAFARAGVLTVSALALAGCGLFAKDKAPPPCPRVSLLSDASHETRFADGPGRDIIDIVLEAEVTDVKRACQYEVDDKTETGKIETQLLVSLDLSRGPAAKSRETTFSYFVALTDAAHNVLQKQVFPNKVEFPPNRSRVAWTDEAVTITIPLVAKQTGRDFEVYVGLQLTPDEVEYNRTKQTAPAR
jgi:hypothetical protein